MSFAVCLPHRRVMPPGTDDNRSGNRFLSYNRRICTWEAQLEPLFYNALRQRLPSITSIVPHRRKKRCNRYTIFGKLLTFSVFGPDILPT